MRKLTYKPIVKLGNGATVSEEASNFIHAMGNWIMVLYCRMEIRKVKRKARITARHKHLAALRK